MEKKQNDKNIKKEDPPKDGKDKDAKKDDENKKEEVLEKETSIMTMPKGDYTVHVLIEEVRNLSGKEEDSLPEPIVKISCLKKEKRTTKLSTGCQNYTFVEHFYFEKGSMSLQELDSEKIVIEVIDNNNKSRADYLGIYEFDFMYIYNNKDHSLHNFWIALANPESSDITKVHGYLKLSISVLHESDPRVELKYKSKDENTICVVPPQVKMEYIQISINLFKAEHLPDMDVFIKENKVNKECNGFVIVKYMGVQVRSSVRDMKNDMIIWNECIEIPVSVPVVSQKIVLEFYDKDALSDDIIGSFELDVNDILKNRYSNFKFISLYGAPINRDGKYTDKMNSNPEIGSLWKGRILMKVDHKKTDNPKKACGKILDENLLKEVGKIGKKNNWFLDFYLYDASFLPSESSEYSLKICIEENEYVFDAKKANKRNITFNLGSSLAFQTLASHVVDLSDVFIYLVKSKVNICFQRLKAEAVFNKGYDIIVVKLLPDPSVGKIDESVFSGVVKMKLNLHGKEMSIPLEPSARKNVDQKDSLKRVDSEESDDFVGLDDEQNNLKKQILQKAPTVKGETYVIVANIHMSRYLISGDGDGTSDPYVKLTIGEIEKKSTVKYDTINCIWNESLIFENVKLDLDDKSTWPIMFMQIMDKDHVIDDMIAYNYVWLSDSSYAVDELPKLLPKWQQLHLPVSNRPQGQLLCSFYIINTKRSDLLNIVKHLDITPESVLYSCEINVLGLRDLQPLGLMPVKKAFISFDLNSINVTGRDDQNLKVIKTQPKKSGTHPTINTVIKFDIRLPKDEIFMPEMQCIVYDYILAGLANQILGVFIIPLRNIIKENEKVLRRDMMTTHQKLGLAIMENQFKDSEDKKSGGQGGDLSHLSQISKNYLDHSNILQDDEVLNKKSNDSQGKQNLLKNENGTSNSVDNKKYNQLKEEKSEEPNNQIVINVDKNNPNIKEGAVNPNEIKLQINEKQSNSPAVINNDLTKYNRPENFLIKPIYVKYTLPGNKPGSKNYKEFEIEDEKQAPPYAPLSPHDLYEPIGHNKSSKDNKKHYRRKFNCNLEDARELGLSSPFYKLHLKRGRFVDQNSEAGIFEALTDKNSKIIKRFSTLPEDKDKANKKPTLKEIENQAANQFFDGKTYGDFKGLIRIVEKSKLTEYEQVVEQIRNKKDNKFLNDFKFLTNFEDISKKILIEKECVVRVYILKLGDLKNKDTDIDLGFGGKPNLSDPYVKLSIGDQVIDESKNYLSDKDNVDWFKVYDLNTILPGDGSLKIDVYDYDPLFSDELIGTTIIDVEDRFFDNKWKDMKDKPIEKRILYHPDLDGPQGWVSLWVEVFEKSERRKIDRLDISPPPIQELEMRLIVWETEDTPCADIEDMSDYYVSCFVDNNIKKSTDVHYRCEKGNMASFNWRILLPVSYPCDNTLLNIQLMDNDLFSGDDYVSGAVLDIGRIIKDVYFLDVPIKFDKDYWDGLTSQQRAGVPIEFKTEKTEREKFWLGLEKSGGQGKGGKVLLSLEILPKWKAQICKVGTGRDEPNCNPYLPAPLGRFKWSLNPFSILNQLVGARFRRQFYCALCCALLVLYLIFVVPYILLHLSGEALNPFNYKSKL